MRPTPVPAAEVATARRAAVHRAHRVHRQVQALRLIGLRRVRRPIDLLRVPLIAQVRRDTRGLRTAAPRIQS